MNITPPEGNSEAVTSATPSGTLFQFPRQRLVYCECGRMSALEIPPTKLSKLRCAYCPPEVGDGARKAVREFGDALERLSDA